MTLVEQLEETVERAAKNGSDVELSVLFAEKLLKEIENLVGRNGATFKAAAA